MNEHIQPSIPVHPLDELAKQLLECGGVLSQIISHMVRYQPRGDPPPDLAPIPEVAQSLIRDVLDEVGKRHSKRDIRVAAAIVAEATRAISENIFFVGPELN
jgi:hypothetical protein